MLVAGAQRAAAGTAIFGTLMTMLVRPKIPDAPLSQACTQRSLRLGCNGPDELPALLEAHADRLGRIDREWRIAIPTDDEEALRWLRAAQTRD
jgi:hypothetical protein